MNHLCEFLEEFQEVFWDYETMGTATANHGDPAGLMLLQMAAPAVTRAGHSGLDPLATISLLATVSSCFMIFSPMAVMFSIARTKRLGKESPLPYFLLFAQAVNWVFYGVLTGRPGIVHVNVLCSVMVFMYLSVMVLNANPEDRHVVRPLLVAGVLTVVGVSVGVLCLHGHETQVTVFSRLALVLNIMLYVAPCFQLSDCIRNRSVEGFPIALTSASFVSSFLWAQYSWLVGSMAYLVPNAAGVLFNGVQLILVSYVHFKFRERGMDEDLEEFAMKVKSDDRSRLACGQMAYGSVDRKPAFAGIGQQLKQAAEIIDGKQLQQSHGGTGDFESLLPS